MPRAIAAAATAVLVAAVTVGTPGPAVAANPEFGSTCTGAAVLDDITLVLTGAATNPALPVAAPATGVITKARFTLPTVPTVYPTAVKVVRATGVANEFGVVAQSSYLNVGSGVQTFDVRVPVAAGDQLAIGGPAGAIACVSSSASDTVGAVAGDAAPGTTATVTTLSSRAIPVAATIEPDADLDGFGDLTQDQCPNSAAAHVACPVVTLDSFAVAQGKKVTVTVAASHQSIVSLAGRANVRGKTVALDAGSQTVTPGTLSTFKVKLPKQLKAALKKLSPRKSITVTFTASSTGPTGVASTDTATVKVPGTKKS